MKLWILVALAVIVVVLPGVAVGQQYNQTATNQNEQWFFLALAIILLVGPMVPVALMWHRLLTKQVHRKGFTDSAVRLVASVSSVSYVFMWLGLMFKPLIGSDYSSRRYATIETNVGLLIIGVVLSAVIRHSIRALLVTSSVLIFLAWFFIWAMSTAV
jgi:hypothetical protein